MHPLENGGEKRREKTEEGKNGGKAVVAAWIVASIVQ